MRIHRRNFILRFPHLTTLVVCAALAVAPAAAYHEEILDNGLRVILIEHHANPMIASSVVVGAGVVHEPPGMNGSSHFLEHLLFNGTQKRTQRQLYDEVDRYGAYNNATTREDHTLFSLLIQKEFVRHGLDIQSDMLFHSTLPPEKFEKEKGIVLEELAKDRNDPSYLADTDFRAFAYAGTPLANPVLGSEQSIRALSRDEVMAYYHARYVPSNMVLVVMGDFDTPEMLKKVRATFGTASAVPQPAPVAATWPAPPEKNLRTEPLEAGRVYLNAGFPITAAPYDDDMAAVELLLAALASGKDAPLVREITGGAEPPALSFSMGVVPRTAPWSTVEISATLPEGSDPKQVLDAVGRWLQRLGPAGPVRGRIAAVRAASEADEVITADRIHYYAMMRSSYILGSPAGYLDQRTAQLEAVSPEALDRAADRLTRGLSSIRVLVAGPGIREGVARWTPPPAAPAESGRQRLHEDRTLPSGMRVAVDRNDDSRVFAMHLMFRPRSASEPKGKEGIADFLHRLFLRGTLVHDADALSQRLDELGIQAKAFDDPRVPFDDYYSTPGFSFVRFEMPADQWREGVALLAEMVRYPRLDPAEVEAVRRRMLDLQKRKAESTRSVAYALAARTLFPGHPLSMPILGTPESVGSITVDDLREFQRRYVVGKRMVLTAVGPVNPDRVAEAVGGAFAGLAPGEDLPAIPALADTPPGKTAEAALGKGQAYLMLGYLFDAPRNDRPALTVAAALLSDALSFHLREELGLAYAMGAGVRPVDGRMLFRAVMGTRQENLDRALAGLRAGIASFRDRDFSEEDVRRAANARRGRLLMRRLTRINQAYFAGMEILSGRPRGDSLAQLDALLKVTPADVRRVVRKYLDPGRCAVITVK